MDGGCTGDVTLGLATGVGSDRKVTVDLGKEFRTDSFKILEPGQDEDTCKGGNDGGRSMADIEEMELRFTLPPPENTDHYWY